VAVLASRVVRLASADEERTSTWRSGSAAQ
jgi:hypothetical protein